MGKDKQTPNTSAWEGPLKKGISPTEKMGKLGGRIAGFTKRKSSREPLN